MSNKESNTKALIPAANVVPKDKTPGIISKPKNPILLNKPATKGVATITPTPSNKLRNKFLDLSFSFKIFSFPILIHQT